MRGIRKQQKMAARFNEVRFVWVKGRRGTRKAAEMLGLERPFTKEEFDAYLAAAVTKYYEGSYSELFTD